MFNVFYRQGLQVGLNSNYYTAKIIPFFILLKFNILLKMYFLINVHIRTIHVQLRTVFEYK